MDMKPVPSYPPETLEAMRVEFTDLLLETKRPGMEDLLAWLDGETDFFTAPASTQFHGAIRGEPGFLADRRAAARPMQG